MQGESTSTPWTPTDTVPYLLGHAARLFNKRANDRLRELGVGWAQVPVLRALHSGTRLSQTALAAFANIEQPTMAQMLSRMEREGVVRRSPNPEDRRSYLYSLTPKARRKVPAVRRALEDTGRELLAGLDPADLERVGDALRTMVANLQS